MTDTPRPVPAEGESTQSRKALIRRLREVYADVMRDGPDSDHWPCSILFQAAANSLEAADARLVVLQQERDELREILFGAQSMCSRQLQELRDAHKAEVSRLQQELSDRRAQSERECKAAEAQGERIRVFKQERDALFCQKHKTPTTACLTCALEIGHDCHEAPNGHGGSVRWNGPAAPASPSGWQPIETAPMDGLTHVLVVCGNWVGEAVFALAEEDGEGEWMRPDVPGGIIIDPTHWMPLPPAPQTGDQP